MKVFSSANNSLLLDCSLPSQPGSAEFAARYDELRRERVEPKRGNRNVAFGPNSLGSVIEKWIASEDFTSKAHNTKRRYRRIADRIKEICGRALIADSRDEHVREIRSRFLPATFAADEAVMLSRFCGNSQKKI